MASTCLFCKIVAKEIPAQVVYEDAQVVVLRDMRPVAPTHVLVIPREHFAGLSDAGVEHQAVLGHALLTAARVARDLGFAEEGYRTVINTGGHAGQTVSHLHVHVLAGREMAWPPG